MKLFKQKIPTKTREQIEKEIDYSLSNKDQSQRGKMLKKARFALLALYPKEKIREMFIDEYIKKYGELKTGKTSLEQIHKESITNAKKLEQIK